MIIDVQKKIQTAQALTQDWAKRAEYQFPEKNVSEISKKARDLQRIMNVSSFGCQRRHVHSILQVLIGEEFPILEVNLLAEYGNLEPFVIGSLLVPLSEGDSRTGLVVRRSANGNAGLRSSNGDLQQRHWSQNQVRPATDEEIEEYFSEFYGESVNPLDDRFQGESTPF